MVSFFNQRDPDAQVRDLLSAYIDDRCTPAERMLVEARLAENEALRNELADLRDIVGGLRQMPQVELPRSFYLTQSMLETNVPRTNPFEGLLRTLRLATNAVAALFVIALIGAFFQSTPGALPTSAPSAPPRSESAPASAPVTMDATTGANATPQMRTAAGGAAPTRSAATTGAAAQSAPSGTPAAAILSAPQPTIAAATAPSTTLRTNPPADAQTTGTTQPEVMTKQAPRSDTARDASQPSPFEQIRAAGLWSVAGGLFVLLALLLATRAIMTSRM